MTERCTTPGLMSLEAGLETLRREIKPVLETELAPLHQCCGRVLAQGVISPVHVPSHNNSAMDGYALRLSDLSQSTCLPLAGQSLAGHPFQGELPVGHCIRIMTGANIPQGADTVIMQEHTEKQSTGVNFYKVPKVGSNIRLAGEDIEEGSEVFKQGHRVRPQDVGLLASLGVPGVSVFLRVKVATFSTGDELKLPGDSLGPGEIYDSNRFALNAMLERLAVEVIDLGRIPDDPEHIRVAFSQADELADAVITSGGVSVGDADFVKDVLNELGETSFWKLAIKPGKPFAFGTLPGSYFFGLPGNPVSAIVTFQQLAAPALLHLMGATPKASIEINAACTTRLRKSPGRREFQRGILTLSDEGQAEVCSTGSQGSGILRSMSMANCYIVLPESQGSVEPGETVRVQLFDQLLL